MAVSEQRSPSPVSKVGHVFKYKDRPGSFRRRSFAMSSAFAQRINNARPIILKKKITIGRKDKASFPEFGLKHLDIKMDTGAYTSTIHCHKIEKKEKAGEEVVAFTLLDPSHPQYNEREFSTKNFREKQVKSSTGISEERFIVETEIVLFGKKYPIQMSLSERGEMKTPILIGRRFLKGKFVVDASKSNVSYKERKKQIKK